MDLKQLTELNAPSGAERGIRNALLKEARRVCGDVRVDRAGNVLCHKPGKNPDLPHVLLAAHMDEVGFIVNGYTEDGLLRFQPVGGVDPRAVVSKWVTLGEEKLPGVIGAMAIHLQTAADRERVLDYDGLYIDIGAKDRQEAEQRCPLGTYASFDTPYTLFGDGFVCAKALDDRVGCYNLLRILEGDWPGPVTCAFVTQEEVGLRGSRAAGYAVQPDIAIVFEGTAANDLGDTPEQFRVCTPGKGVAVSFMDLASIADRELYQRFFELARTQGIPCQAKQGVTGGNDAGAIQRAGRGARTCVLSVPCRYIHSGASVARLSDLDAQYALAAAFLNHLTQGG